MFHFAVISIFLAAPAFAQTAGGSSEQLYQWDGVPESGYFGLAVAGAGDINGDGIPDMIVGASQADPGGLPRAGAVYVYSGSDGSLLHYWSGAATFDYFGYSVSGAGDVNGDGFADVVVGAVNASPGSRVYAGAAYVYSGADGSLLYQWDGAVANDSLGASVSGAGDVNGDGFADLIISATGADPGGQWLAGSVYVYSGAGGALLYQWDGVDGFDLFGHSVSGAGDVNGDGFADVIVGAHLADPGGLLYAGSAFVYSGTDGSLLYQWDGQAGDQLGGSVSDAGDVNGDGFADVIVGASTASPGGASETGSVFTYSGADGSLLHQWNGEEFAGFFGSSVSGAGDVDGDGFADLIVGAPHAGRTPRRSGSGSAYLYSGSSGSLLHKWDGQVAGDDFGSSVAGVGDINGDGSPDVIVGAYSVQRGGFVRSGSAYVYSFQSFLRANHSSISAAAGGVLDLTLDFPDSAAFMDYISLMSVAGTGPVHYGADIPLSLDSFLLDSAAGIYPFAVTSNLQGTLDASGNASASITFPAGAFSFAVGRTFWLAAVAFQAGPIPVRSSVAVAVEFLP